ncbi:MAG: glycoside hydrolase family 28 protein [Roseburia sp.]|nr:glycoside hydrolase family 28 protein [Roseburia sp.]
MELKLLMKSARSVTLELADGGIYNTKETFRIFLNGAMVKETDQVITSVFGLKPETNYDVHVKNMADEEVASISFATEYEFVTLNVRDFGAKGDGVSDDTKFIQAAILSCPKESRVLVPAGTYKITSLFLKSNLNLELAKGAELLAETDRYAYPMFPALIESYDETDEYNLGTWEGNPLPMFAGIITGVDVENVLIYGEGTINGNASKENWWHNPKVMVGAYRPRLFFINHCNHVTLQGVTCCNSPSWTLHPYFSNDLKFYNLTVKNPSDSPNTDGLDPESCKNVEIAGVKFSLGDDCIAVKSGKIYMGRKHKTPSENLHIRQCLMENGHGAVTIGSEMAGGVINLVVEDCLFSHTDRGLRIKTRRGRGKDAIIDNVIFKNIKMDHVMTPFVANSFYFCDPDGKTAYVQSREAMEVDDRTPHIKRMVFEDIEAKNCHVAAAHFDGLPEQKIDEIVMKNVSVTYTDNPKCDVPAMSEGVEACTLKGIFANNVKKLTLENVVVTGQVGEAIILQGVDEVCY